MALSSGTRLGQYEILAPLGAGGMGEVYRARDAKLDRDVAIKVLPQSVAADPDSLARFEREAKAVAALSHPNILSIFDFGAEGSVSYAVMELLEGETLRGRLDAGPITQKQAVDYALQVARGLAAAHEKGIVHRDLKPENLFVSRDGHVKILDFGLAKRVEAVAPGEETSAPTNQGHTEPGTVMGTAGYMSPEQVKGLSVDHRSDIFSFGTILYELLSGKKAFKRDTSAETMAAILRDEPPELSESGRNISPALDRIVKHCLEKNRESRFQTARDIAFSLSEQFAPMGTSGAREITPAVTSAGLRVAVLPFKSSGDAEMEAFADGLGEEITTGLSRFRYLSVVASASAARLKGEAGDERALGARLGARYVLEGSVRKGGSAIRVSAQLVDTQTGAQLWSETYNRDLQTSSIFAAQDDVAGRIVATVADSYGVLVNSMRSAIRQKDDAALTSVEWQFQYFGYREQITPAAHAALRSRLERAVDGDARQSDLWACLAQIFVDEYAFGFPGSDATSLDRALAAARRAVELDRANQFALVSLAQAHFFRQDLAAFGPAAERAMALNPLNTDAVGILGLQIVHTGEFERGAAIVRRAMELNANHAGWMHFAPLWEHFHKGEYEQALERANRVDVPGLFWPFLVMAAACGHLGRRAEAAAAVRDLLALDPEFAAHARSNIGSWHFASGLMEPLLEGLRKAGLSIPASDGSSDRRRIGTVTATADPAQSDTDSGKVRADEGFWVAVLPFKYGGADASLTALAEGLSEEIVTGLSRFSYLRVIARSSIAHPIDHAEDVRSAGKELGARFVMEGSLRLAGTRVRLAVQLIDTASGAHLWAETFDRAFKPEAAFELQDDLVPRIVATCGDRFGVLARSISDAVRGQEPGQLGPYEALMRGFGYHQRLTPVEHAEAREALERAVERAPSNADCWAMLSWIYSHEHAHGFNARPGSLERALAAARRAVDIAPSNPLAQQTLAVVLFFRKETAGCLSAAERAIALNPLDTSNEAMFLVAFTGDWDRGCALIRRAMDLNPHHPRWYGLNLAINEYRLANYRAAVDEAVKANATDVFWTNLLLAAAHGQLVEPAPAGIALRDLLAQKADFAESGAQLLGKWFDPPVVGHLIEGLRKAGLDVRSEKSAGAPARESSGVSPFLSGEVRADEGFWLAVLPFKSSGNVAELDALAEGLTGDIVTGLSRFSYLRVIAHSSTSRYANDSVDVRTAGKEIGARYVMQGNLRQAGTKLRLAVQLVDAISGAHLWAENFERRFSPETVFELQDDLVPRIVSTVADMYGVLPRSMSETLRGKAEEELSPHEAVLCAFGYMERVTPDEHARVRRILERAVRIAPNQGDAWAMLANLYWEEHAHGLNPQPDPLGRALAAARRAVEAAPSSNLAHYALACTLFFQKDLLAFRSAAERALELNRMDASVAALIGNLIAYSGDWERGTAVVESARQLNPRHPGWYWFADFNDAYRRRDYRGALGFALKINQPGNFYTHAVTAAAYGQLGMREEARKSMQEVLAIRPDFAETAREELGRWFFDPAFAEHNIDGFRRAGLEIAEEGGASAAVTASDSGAARADEGFWVAVLPFKYSGNVADLAFLAEGLTEDIVTGLSRFSYLRVIARSSTSGSAAGASEPRAAAMALGARYVMEGSVRQSGTKLRVAAQVVDAMTGAHLWAENYERVFRPEAVFEAQDALVPRIVSTVADSNGVLARTMSEAVRSRDPELLTPYEAVLRSFGYGQRVTPEELGAARSALESAVRKAPAYADAWAMLSWLHVQDYAQGFNLQADSLKSGLAAAQRAVEAAPSNALAYFSLAPALFFHREYQSFRNAAERAVALNPMDGNSIAFMGELLTYAGDWERGLELAGRAKQLNPNYPGWYWYADFYDAYRRGDYRGALGFALKVDLPGQWFAHASKAAALAQLGERDAAAKAVRDLLRVRPDFAATARGDIEKWWESEYVASMIDGWRKAGLEIAGGTETALPELDPVRSPTPASGAVRADEGFWVAVLPFKYSGANAELAALAEGLTEDIVTGLSRFSYLRVIARSSTSRYASESVDVRTAGRELGARYVMEGNLRQAGAKLRLAVQLVDSISGAHLWAENYERTFRPEAVFELQDDLVPRIVSTVADTSGVLPHSISEMLRKKGPDELSPYEAVLRSFGYYERITPEEHAKVRDVLERAVENAPEQADCWAMLAMIYKDEHTHGFNVRPDPLGRALAAAHRAVQAAPSNHLAHHALASALFFRREIVAFRNAAERTIALNAMDGGTTAFVGHLMAYAGDWERGCALVEHARQLNPNHPGWYWFPAYFDAYRKRDYRGALEVALKINMPGYFYESAVIAAAYGQLGEGEAARSALRQLLARKPDFAAAAREELGKWFGPGELLEHFLDGLREAGLDIPALGDADAQDSRSSKTEAVAIAVLPFSDMSPAQDQQYLCEGMAEEIMNALVQVGGIRVASRTSAFRAQKDGSDPSAIARALSVGHVLEGSVQTSGTRLRVTAQLTDVASGYQLWSERYDRDAADIFAVQDEITAGVVEAVQARLAPGERGVRARPQVGDLEAYRLYLKGQHLRYTKNDHGGALTSFEQATALDPSHGPSWVGLADVSVLSAAYGLRPSGEAYAAAKAALQTAAQLQEESAEALYVEAMIAFGERRWKDSERLLARATEVEPGHVQARCWTGILLGHHGRTEEALAALEQAREIDPLAPYPYAMTGLCLLQARRPEEAGRFVDQALAFDQDNILALWVSGAALTARRLFDPAIARLDRAVALSNRGAFIHGTLGWALAEAGRVEDAKAVLAALRARPAPSATALPEAWLLAALGDREGAWQVLDRACDEKQLLVSFTGLPGFDPLRADSRFEALPARMGLPPARATAALP